MLALRPYLSDKGGATADRLYESYLAPDLWQMGREERRIIQRQRLESVKFESYWLVQPRLTGGLD